MFRILRPFSKVTRARCVVCVPRYFYESLQSDMLGDVHSTVRHCYMLGDRRFYGGAREHFAPKKVSVEDFEKELFELLKSRLRVCVDRPERFTMKHAKENAKENEELSGVFRVVLSQFWGVKDGKDKPREDKAGEDKKVEWERISQELARIGPSRRELIRQLDRITRNTAFRPFDKVTDPSLDHPARTQQLLGIPEIEAFKTDYNFNEVALRADLVERQQWYEAWLALSAARAKAETPASMVTGADDGGSTVRPPSGPKAPS